MTSEEMVSRLLYRDGLMLVIDKPAGFAVHRGPKNSNKGGESLEDHFGALRFGLPRAAGARPPARPRHLRMPGARPPPQGARPARPAVQERRHRQDLLGGGRRRAGRRRRRHRASARPPRCDPRLVDEARSQGPTRSDQVAGDGEGREINLACAGARHRPHAPTAGALRGNGLADPAATRSTARRRERAARCCICTPARSSCRFTRTARRSASSRRCRCTCARRWPSADGKASVRAKRRNDGAVTPRAIACRRARRS